jgi:Cu-Zn family superoxide dismutase
LLRNVFLGCSVAAVVGAAIAAEGARAQVPAVGATAEVRDTANRLVATAEFREGRGEVLITIRFPSPPVLSGTHGIHINEVGRCDPPDFLTAGNIFNPFGKKHGRQNPEGAEVGDLPNVNFTTGLTTYNTSAPGATLAAGSASLLNPSRSLVIFSGEDDQKTDPEGNAGTRIACGVITAAAGAPAAPGPAGAVAAASPTATRPAAPAAQAAPKVASPAPAQPAQPAAAQPAAKPANSPVVVRPPAVVNPAASPSPVVAAAGVTPIVAPTPVAAPPLTSGSSGNSLTTLLIALLGVGLVGAGYLLRRRRQLQ